MGNVFRDLGNLQFVSHYSSIFRFLNANFAFPWTIFLLLFAELVFLSETVRRPGSRGEHQASLGAHAGSGADAVPKVRRTTGMAATTMAATSTEV